MPLNKFRELFQARFKASISVLELYKMVDVCHIRTDENEEKHIHLNQAFLAKIEDSPFNPNLQHSIPYCARHFKRENYKGWAEQELEPLPHVFLTISQVQNIVYRLMQSHADGIPVASILHCIEACLNVTITANENGISLEHLLSCAKGVQIENNVYGIKIIGLTKGSEPRVGNNGVVDIYDGKFCFSFLLNKFLKVIMSCKVNYVDYSIHCRSWGLAVLLVEQLHVNACPVAGQRSDRVAEDLPEGDNEL